MNAFLHCQPLGLRAVWTIADQQQLRWNVFANTIEDLNYTEEPLHRPEIRKMHENSLIVGCVLAAMFLPSRRTNVLVAVDEVGDDFNVILDVKDVDGAGAQVLRDGGDAVALLDGKTRDREI